MEIRGKLVGCSSFVKDVKVGLRSFFRKVQKLVRHRAPMRKAKVGIYNPLMWKEECWDNYQLDSSEATFFKDLNPRFDGGFSKNSLKCLFR